MQTVGVELQCVPEERQRPRTGELIEGTRCGHLQRGPRRFRDPDPQLVTALLQREGAEALRAPQPAAISRIEPPAMIAAYQKAALHLSFAQECALVGTAALEGLEAAGRTDHHHVAPGGEREWTLALQIGNSGQKLRLRLVRQNSPPSDAHLTPIVGCYP
jgi:hypothetical protein